MHLLKERVNDSFYPAGAGFDRPVAMILPALVNLLLKKN